MCLYIKLKKIGFGTTVRISISQAARDIKLLESLIDYLGCGYVHVTKRGDCEFSVRNTSEILSKIIPFFDENRIEGIKAMDYRDFQAIAEIISTKQHLTEDGLAKIQTIKAGMNGRRLLESQSIDIE